MANSGSLYPSTPGLDLHNGKFTDGNAQAGLPPSVLNAGTLNLILDNLAEAIKAAGLVPDNGAASIEQLKKSLLWAAGQWQEGTDYLQGAQVLHRGAWHIATSPHTATTANAPGQASAPWAALMTDAQIKAYADQAESDAIAAASGKDTALESKLNTAIATAKNAAISAANSHANTQDNSHDTSLQTWVKNYIRSNVFPVGSFFLTAVNKNPATFIGGTWEAQDAKNRFLCTSTGNTTSNNDIESLPKITGRISSAFYERWLSNLTDGAFRKTSRTTSHFDSGSYAFRMYTYDLDASRNTYRYTAGSGSDRTVVNQNQKIYARIGATDKTGYIQPRRIYLGLWKRTA